MKRHVRSRYWITGVATVALFPAGCIDGSSDGVEALSTDEVPLVTGAPLIGAASGRCLDVKGRSTTPGAVLQIYTCNGQDNQGFNFTSAGELQVYGGTRCVEAQNGRTSPGTKAVIGNCNGQARQQWTMSSAGAIVHQQSGLCLDVEGRRTTNGTAVQLWTCNGQTNQQWSSPAGADTQAPTPPSGVSASNVTCSSATLSWAASTDNVGVASYDIYHDGQQMTSVSGSTLSTSLTVMPGVSWGVYVNARDAAGNVSQASETLRLATPHCEADNQPPTAPTNLTGSASGTSVTLQWAASTDNVAVTAYDVHRNGAKVGTVPGTASSPPARSFVDSGLSAATAYTYHVVARDAQSNASPASGSISVTTGSACSTAVCEVVQVATDNDLPWGLVSLPDGTVLYSRRDADDIVHLDPSTGVKTSIGTVPNVAGTDGEGGLMGLAIAPTFESDRWLYIMHTSSTDNRIVRIKVIGNRLDTSTEQVLVSGILRNKYHNGGRLRWGPDGKLYASTGDAQNANLAQDTSSLSGKILRIEPDGRVPSDNPFGNYVWSYGHRNPQGLAFDSQGRLWEQEFGNTVMDETNLIQRGGNYGWPNCEGTTSQGGSGCGTSGYIAPKLTYRTAEGSCSGIAIVNDVFYAACQRGTRMYRAVISGSSLTGVQQLFVGTYGRLRTVEPTLDGDLWLTTTNTGGTDSVPNNSNEQIFRVILGD
ncbi:PQQ-dependent sugar dehydrogenase [Sorangium sp. So ce887]|uniref:PQQ-dependent sugar dehydrogenase n=1 Tax=Sorangium sp. So ce887 TaxID=3133324 RepID=UPI003F62A8B9